MLLHYDEFASPIGRILFASDGEAICALDFEDYRERMKRLLGADLRSWCSNDIPTRRI